MNDNKPIKPQPNLSNITTEELLAVVNNDRTINYTAQCQRELFRRLYDTVQSQAAEINTLKQLLLKPVEKSGRKRQTFFIDGKELDDDYLIYLIDYEYYDSIRQLERFVGAKKNQLRNRYLRAKDRNIKAKKLKGSDSSCL